MADWYVSSVAWAAIAQFAASHAYNVGDIVRPLTAPAFSNQFAFRCTTAGTSGAEPTWTTAQNNNTTVTSGGTTFTNVSAQSAYGWAAAAGNLWCMTNQGPATGRLSVGDRIFLSSDHSETNNNANYVLANTAAFGVIEVISVNRAGSVPPVAADQVSGAAIIGTSSALDIDCTTNMWWQGIAFTLGGAGSQIFLGSTGVKANYLKNCSLIFTTSNTTAMITANGPARAILDNTTVTFNNAGQRIALINNPLDFVWLNTPGAVLGTVPTTLFYSSATNQSTYAVCRGVDLSAVTTNLCGPSGNSYAKVLLDSCRVASGVTRLSGSSYNTAADEVELVNCFDGTNILSERHTPAGDLTTNRSTTLVGGAQDDVGLYSHQMVSSARSDFLTMTLDSLWLDVENAFTGALRTATVEIISGGSLNNTDISLMLEYLGTSGSSLASFANSLPNALTASAALPASTATWNGAPFVSTTWNPADLTSVTLSGGNIVATGNATPCGVRGVNSLTSGKYYWEYTYTTIQTNSITGGLALSTASLTTPTTGTAIVARSTGNISVNNVATGSSLGIIGVGNVVGVAVDFTAQLIWFRIAPSGNWNGSGTANPATGTGGLSISTITGALYPLMSGANLDALTANFGASAFSGTVPSGFAPGFPGVGGAQRLQVSFTPQQTGRLRGLVRLGKVSTTVWVNPQITVS